MKKYLILLILMLFWCLALPIVSHYAARGTTLSDSENYSSETDAKTQESEDEYSYVEISDGITTSRQESSQSLSVITIPETVRVFDAKTEKTVEMALEDYIIGVVYAEIPSSFEEEAIKAQSVAARTYTLYNILYGGRESNHPGADVCTNASHCSAFMTVAEAAEKYGDLFAEESFDIIKKAVNETKGQVMIYDGRVINAVFHASSSGFTESCEDVWLSPLPYLVSVETPDESDFYSFYGKAEFTAAEFTDKFIGYECDFSGPMSGWITDLSRNASGRCSSIKIGGVDFGGSAIRTLLGLKSTDFTVGVSEGKIIFETKGYGHGVGMSQYGANIMASEGSSFETILEHYYSGVEIRLISSLTN